MWIAAAALLPLSDVTMLLVNEVNWGPLDLVVLAAMPAAVCGPIDVASRRSLRAAAFSPASSSPSSAYSSWCLPTSRSASSAAKTIPLICFFILIPIIRLAGTVFAHFRAAGMARSLEIMAVVQAGTPLIAWPGAKTVKLLAMTFFAAIWLAAARMLRTAD